MKDEGFKSTKTDQRGKNPGQAKNKKSHWGHGCLSVVSVVCCQVEVSATSWSLVQRSPTDCGVSHMCVTMKPRRNEEAQAHIGLSSHKKNIYNESCGEGPTVCNKPRSHVYKRCRNPNGTTNPQINASALKLH
jgi:hypothetical protein